MLPSRVPFFIFLFPVFLFALTVSPNLNPQRVLWVLAITQVLLFPSIAVLTNHFEEQKNTGSSITKKKTIGWHGLAWTLTISAIIFSYLYINQTFTALLLLYFLASVSFSHPSIPWKKYLFLRLLLISFFQGFISFITYYTGFNNYSLENLAHPWVLIPAVLSSVAMLAYLPLAKLEKYPGNTSEEKQALKNLHVQGTFYYAGNVALLAIVGFVLYAHYYLSTGYVLPLGIAISPIAFLFFFWMRRVDRNSQLANRKNIFWLNIISAITLTLFFFYLFVDYTNILQVL